jgi:hypothetical protein
MTMTFLPVLAAITGMACTRPFIDVPVRRTPGTESLPDTTEPLFRMPAVEDLTAAPGVLSKIERHEQRLRQWPRLARRVDAPRTSQWNRGDTDRRRATATIASCTEKVNSSAQRCRIRYIEVRRIVGSNSGWGAVGRGCHSVGQRPPNCGFDLLKAQPESPITRPLWWFGG